MAQIMNSAPEEARDWLWNIFNTVKYLNINIYMIAVFIIIPHVLAGRSFLFFKVKSIY